MSVMLLERETQKQQPVRGQQRSLAMDDILSTRPTKPGLYVVSGYSGMVPLILDKVVDFLGQEMRSTYRLYGPREVGKLMWIDSGNSFDAYHMAHAAAVRGLEPVRVLRSLQVARPFTAYQFQQMLSRVPNPVHFSNQSRIPVVIISDLMGLFYDPEIQEGDVQRAFQEFMIQLSSLKKKAIVLALQLHYMIPDNRKQFLPRVLSLVDNKVLMAPRFNHKMAVGF